MAIQQDALHCVTCQRSLPEGQEPDYFGQVSTGYSPEYEVERAAEDVDCCLRYAKTVNSALWTMLQVAEVKSPELMDSEHYFEKAHSLCFLLDDLVREAERRVQTLSRVVAERMKQAEGHASNATRKEG